MQKKMKLFAISVLTIVGLLLNPLTMLAEGKILLEKNYTVNSNENLSVKASTADLQIKSWDRDEVYIQIIGRESINDYFDFEFSYNSGTVSLFSKKKSDWGSWSMLKDFAIKISVPSKFNIDVNIKIICAPH